MVLLMVLLVDLDRLRISYQFLYSRVGHFSKPWSLVLLMILLVGQDRLRISYQLLYSRVGLVGKELILVCK